jgi:hypothetical protein
MEEEENGEYKEPHMITPVDGYIGVTNSVVGFVFLVNACFAGLSFCLGIFWMRVYLHIQTGWLQWFYVCLMTSVCLALYNVMIFFRKQLSHTIKMCVLGAFLMCSIIDMGLFCGLFKNISMIQLSFLVFVQSVVIYLHILQQQHIQLQMMLMQTLFVTIFCWVFSIYAFIGHQDVLSTMSTFLGSCALCFYYQSEVESIKKQQFTITDDSKLDALIQLYTNPPTWFILKVFELHENYVKQRNSLF